jgi:hypothetical protein
MFQYLVPTRWRCLSGFRRCGFPGEGIALELGFEILIQVPFQGSLCSMFVDGDIRFFFFFSRDRVSLCSPGCPGTHSVDQAGLELRNPPPRPAKTYALTSF